jgi:hypothetical protein
MVLIFILVCSQIWLNLPMDDHHFGYITIFFIKKTTAKDMIIVNQHAPAHHEGWLVSGYITVFCWVPIP